MAKPAFVAGSDWTVRRFAETLVLAANNGTDPKSAVKVAVDGRELDLLGVWFEKGKIVVRAMEQEKGG